MHNAKWQAVWLTLAHKLVMLLTFYRLQLQLQFHLSPYECGATLCHGVQEQKLSVKWYH